MTKIEQAAQQQELVGYFAYDEEHDIWEELTGPNAPGATPLYTALQPVKQEPVAIDWDKTHEVLCDVWNRVISADDGLDAIQDLIYAAPVRTKDLTDEEIQNAMMPIEPTGKGYLLRLARAVIAADREKNK